MASVLSPINLLVLLAVLFISVDCDHHEGEKFDLSNTKHFGSVSHVRDEPNFFNKIGHHIIKGWHGLRSLFGRKSKRREENGYGHGGLGREEVQKPFEKEVVVNKEYPEPEASKEYPSNPRPSAYQVDKDKHSHGHKEEERIHPEDNQGYQGGIDERSKEEGKKDQRNGHKKDRDFEKRSADEPNVDDTENDGTEDGPDDEDHKEWSGHGLEKRSVDEMNDENDDTEDGPENEGSNEETEEDTSTDGDEQVAPLRFKRAAKGGRSSFRPRTNFRGLHGRTFRRP